MFLSVFADVMERLYLPSHHSLGPAMPQQGTDGNGDGKVNIQSLVW